MTAGVYEMHNESVFSCRCATPSKFGKIAALILYPGIGLIAGLAGIYLCINLSLSEDMLQQRGIFLPAIIVAFSISVFMLWLSTICYNFETKKCIVHKNGITIVGRKEIFYNWNDMHGIVIAAYGAAANKQIYQKVLCCFLTPPSPNILHKICSSYIWGASHAKEVIIIDFESPAVKEIYVNYPQEIGDCRKEQLGRFS